MFAQNPAADDIDYKIVLAQNTYHAGETARVWLMVLNRGTLPIYILRRFVHCSNPSVEFAEIRLLDKRGHDVGKEKKCAAEILLENPIAALADARFWIALGPSEAYGSEAHIEMPGQKGEYRVESELFPPGFYEGQKEALAKRQMRVLRERHKAEGVVITVR